MKRRKSKDNVENILAKYQHLGIIKSIDDYAKDIKE